MKLVRPEECKSRTKHLLQSCVERHDYSPLDPDESVLKWLFKVYPNNTDRDEVGVKVSVLNALYGTQIGDTGKVADHICKMRSLDKTLRAKKMEEALRAIPLIAEGHGLRMGKRKKESYLLSFASKYSHFRRPEVFPIYDAYATNIGLLRLLKHLEPDASWTQERLKEPVALIEGIMVLKRKLGVWSLQSGGLGYKDIDNALWPLGQSIYYAEHSGTVKERKENKGMDYVHANRIPAFMLRGRPALRAHWTCSGHT